MLSSSKAKLVFAHCTMLKSCDIFVSMTNALAYFDKEKKFYDIETWAQCNETFYVRNLQMLAIS
jgi:hypothetical protein